MTEPLPKWIQTRYAILWNKFGKKEFTFEQAEKALKGNTNGIAVFLSDLKKAGWLTVNLSSEDSRIRLYKLKSPEEAITDMANRIKIKNQ